MAIILIYYHRNIPSYLGLGARVLLLLFFFTGVMCNEVLVPRNIDAVLGKNITLGCQIQVGSNLSLTQSSWERRVASSTVTLAVYNPEFGTSITDEYVGRLSFLSASRHDATVLLENVDFADAGVYTCKVATFPMGNKQASTTVNIMVEPKVYVSASSAPLLDGGNETVVATCRAERALPPAEVSWESDLFGRSQEHQQKESDGTATTWVSYSWRPTRHTQKLSLTCVVRHPALQTELRSTHWLNVQFAPEIVLKSIGDWLVGGTDSHLQCRANANPPVGSLTWSRLDGPMPEGVDVVNGTLYFMRPLQQNDSGVYRCTVENDIDTRSRETRVWIRDPPPTTAAAPTTPAPLHPSGGFSHTPPTKQRAQFSSPTLGSSPDTSLGAIVGGIIGGLLLLVLLLVLVGICYMRQRRTFRGDYYTKQYLGPADMQKEPQLDMLEPHELQEVYGGNDLTKDSPDLKPKAAGDIIDSEYKERKDREDWGDSIRGSRRMHGEEDYYPNHHSSHNMYPREIPMPLPSVNNGSPYMSEDFYDSGTDSEYVSHLDGSVISRREWYV
ncbi:nectin-3-like protein [Paramormyrops kingsleyae]|uniref:nectin-3-like protein n=1 Tax=Paramormyrops kingsleyae TaxID=1676925 RepID=UPI000CD5D01F|nr:nectin-3-like protein [Paramormyrops kingsleyae]